MIVLLYVIGSISSKCLYLLVAFGAPLNSHVIFRAIPVDTFLDYIKGGCEITLMIAIDFTVCE